MSKENEIDKERDRTMRRIDELVEKGNLTNVEEEELKKLFQEKKQWEEEAQKELKKRYEEQEQLNKEDGKTQGII